MCALLPGTAVTTEYQRDSSSKRPLSSVALAAPYKHEGITDESSKAYAYSHFCRYRRWARALKPSMRQVHRAGDKTFVDFSGKRPSLVDATTGEEVSVELFVGVLGASG